jgi:hypothetical protein
MYGGREGDEIEATFNTNIMILRIQSSSGHPDKSPRPPLWAT